MKKIKFPLHFQILLALILGVLFGIFFPEQIKYVSWMGEIFMRGLKMIIVPLVLTSIIASIANIGGAGNLGRLGFRTILYYLTTSLLAILTGLFFVNLIKPGENADLGFTQSIDDLPITDTPFSEILINIIPDNIFKSFLDADMVSIIFFAILFGFFITKVAKNYSKLMINFFNASSEVIMKMTQFIIKFTPIGIFGIIAKVISQQNNLLELFEKMGLYMIVVLVGLIVHTFISLPLIVKIFGKENPYKLIKKTTSIFLTAFSTSSSSATLALTLDTMQNKVGVSKRVSNFVLPLGSTVNMDGTALYELVAALFIAQVYGIDLSIGQQIIVVFTALLASIGAAGIPMAGLVMLSVVLSSVGLPLEGIGLIIAVDRFLDMFRTSVNVWSDCCGAVVIAKNEGETLTIETEALENNKT